MRIIISRSTVHNRRTLILMRFHSHLLYPFTRPSGLEPYSNAIQQGRVLENANWQRSRSSDPDPSTQRLRSCTPACIQMQSAWLPSTPAPWAPATDGLSPVAGRARLSPACPRLKLLRRASGNPGILRAIPSGGCRPDLGAECT